MSLEYGPASLLGTLPPLDECATCGRPFPRELMFAEDAPAEEHSTFRELCPDCRKLELQGELLPEAEEERGAPASTV